MPRPKLTIVVVCLGLAACGGSSSHRTAAVPRSVITTTPVDSPTPVTSPSDAGPLAACTLLTQDEASTLAGVKLMPASGAGSDGDQTLCEYDAPPTGETAQVEVLTGDGVPKALSIDQGLEHPFTDCPGIGDECHQEDDDIFFRVGAQWAQIDLVLLNDASADVTPLQTAAKLMAARM